ncbi:hypothetical protein BU064_07795 [Staphylococcus succinus]|nr:hypothetical protein BU064_07795 [Staphylococcus succinus]
MDKSITLNKNKKSKYDYYNDKYDKILKNNKNQEKIEKYNKFSKESIEKRTILYETFHGKSMTDNPYAIFKSMINNPLYKDFLHVWVINAETSESNDYKSYENVIFVKVHTDDYLYYLARAKYLINNTSFPPYFCKRKEQIYTNTWHGTPLKTLGTDMNGPIDQLKNIQRNFAQTDYILSPNKFTTDKLITAHNLKGIYSGEVLETGYPRVDLIEKTNRTEIINKLKKHVNIDDDKKIALYAPTWRGNVGKEIDIKEEIKKIIVNMKENLDKDFQLLLKVHPLLYKYFKNEKAITDMFIPDSIDMCEVLSTVDLLITDYSSVFFDYYVQNKPIILYIYDKEEYLSDRGTYLDFESLNCYVVENEKSLNNLISNVNVLDGCVVNSFVDLQDGNVSEKVIDIIFKGVSTNLSRKFRNDKKNILFFLDKSLESDFEKKIIFINNYFDREKFNIIVLIKSDLSYEEELQVKKLKNVKLFFRFGSLNADKEQWVEYMSAINIGNIRNNDSLLETLSKKEMDRLIGNVVIHKIYNLSNNNFWKIMLGYYPDVINDKSQLLNQRELDNITQNNFYYSQSFIRKFDNYISFEIESQKAIRNLKELDIKFIHINALDLSSKKEIKKLDNETFLIPMKSEKSADQYVLLENFNINKKYIFIDASNIQIQEVLDFYYLLKECNFITAYKIIIYGIDFEILENDIREMLTHGVLVLPILKNDSDLLYLMKMAKYVFILEDFKYSIDKVYYLYQNNINVFVTDKSELLELIFDEYFSIYEWRTFLPILEKYGIESTIFYDNREREI